jgi:hypothetical protein
VYVGTGAGHFEPGRGAKVFVVGSDPEPPLDREDLRAYRQELKHFLAGAYPDKAQGNVERAWGKLQSRSTISLDENGQPVLQMIVDGNTADIGLSPENVLQSDAPPELLRKLLEARLQGELSRRASHGVSETEIVRDWALLQKVISRTDSGALAGGMMRAEDLSGSQP